MRFAALLAAAAVAAPTTLDSDLTQVGIGYICGAERKPAATTPRRLDRLSGMGSGGFPADTASPQAQAWFDYGLKLHHAFYHDDAKRAFQKAELADPDCSLCIWGEALARGPNLNFEPSAEDTANALAAADRAAARARDPLARELAAAMQARYGKGERPELAFAQAMDRIATGHSDRLDLPALAAHSYLVVARRGDRSGVERAMGLLEAALARAPDDTAAIHYYIHASEFAGRPLVALPYAERLGGLAPRASHLVHMAGHTLFRAGRYEEVAAVNAKAIKVDADYAQATALPGPLGEPTYYGHNLMFGMAGALMAGDGALALKYARHASVAYPEGSIDAGRRGALMARTMVVYGRFDPARALAEPTPPASQPYLTVLWRYARGEALAWRRDAAGVAAERAALAQVSIPADRTMDVTVKLLAIQVLDGRAAMLRGRYDEAAALFAAGAAYQERMITGFDPPPWWYPIRRSLAAAQLKAGRYDEAAAEARASLARWPGDALALKVLAEAQARLGQTPAARDDAAKARAVWRGDVGRVPLDLI